MRTKRYRTIAIAIATVVALGASECSCLGDEAPSAPKVNDPIATPDAGPAPLEVAFVAPTDSGGFEVRYEWSFGDGATADAAEPTHTYAEPGEYEVTVKVWPSVSTDPENVTEKTVTVHVTLTIDDWKAAVNEACASSASESDAATEAAGGNPNNPDTLAEFVRITEAETRAVEGLDYPDEYAEEIEAWLTARRRATDVFLEAAADGMITQDEANALQAASLELQPLSEALGLNDCIGE